VEFRGETPWNGTPPDDKGNAERRAEFMHVCDPDETVTFRAVPPTRHGCDGSTVTTRACSGRSPARLSSLLTADAIRSRPLKLRLAIRRNPGYFRCRKSTEERERRNVSEQPSGPEQPAQFTAPTKVCPNCGAQSQTTADKCPNCGKKYKQKKGGGCLKTLLFGFLGLILLIVVIVAAAGGGGDSGGGDSGSGSESGSESGKSGKSGSGSESGKSGKVGQALTNAGTTYKVTDVQTAKTIGNPDLGGARADGTFVIVSLELTNNKNETKTFTDANAKIQTSDEKRYETSDKAVLSFGDQSLLLKDIQPDLTARGKLAFELPPSKVSGSTLIIEDLFGSGEIKVDLGL
jgi:hypothetical protein